MSAGQTLMKALDGSPILRRVKKPGSFVAILEGGHLASGSVQHPERPRVYRNGDKVLMVAGTDDPTTVRFHQEWRVVS